MRRLFLLCALLAAIVLALALTGQPTQALPEYSAQTGEPCATCHISPSGGGLRTPRGQAWLGILGIAMDTDIAEAMELSADQEGVLVVEVQPDSPAAEAGLIGSDKPVTINGEEILIGGDVIVRADGNDVATVQELAAYFQEVGAGEQVSLTILRDGNLITAEVTLGERP